MRLSLSKHQSAPERISIHAPARGATQALQLLSEYHQISIHAPARGATTLKTATIVHAKLISIHAPARGATLEHVVRHYDASNFNPRTREGCDSDELAEIITGNKISIHAPARGATLYIFY